MIIMYKLIVAVAIPVVGKDLILLPHIAVPLLHSLIRKILKTVATCRTVGQMMILMPVGSGIWQYQIITDQDQTTHPIMAIMYS